MLRDSHRAGGGADRFGRFVGGESDYYAQQHDLPLSLWQQLQQPSQLPVQFRTQRPFLRTVSQIHCFRQFRHRLGPVACVRPMRVSHFVLRDPVNESEKRPSLMPITGERGQQRQADFLRHIVRGGICVGAA